MDKKNKRKPRPKVLVKYTWWLVAAWTLILGGLLTWDMFTLEQATKNLAVIEARAHFNKDEAFRFWSATHGGFYVPINGRTPPSPYLSHIFERDIETPSGVKLTLMNPAYAIRQMNEDFAETYGVSGHITSLLPLRPENAPDDWEVLALKSFENGETEVLEFMEFDSQPYLRFMRPLITQKGCLKCHAHQGYQVGDVRGGVSVSVPIAAYMAEEHQATSTHMISYAVLWALGFGFLIMGSRLIMKSTLKRQSAQGELSELYGQLEIRVEERTAELAIANQELQAEFAARVLAEKILDESEERYKGIIQSTASCIAVYKPIDNGHDFVFVDINPMAEKVEQMSKDKVIGKKVTEIFPGIVEFGLLEVFQNVWKTGNPEHFPVSVYNDNRIQGYRENYIYKLPSGEIVAVYQDLTERKLAEQALSESEKRIRELMESLPIGIIISTFEGDVQEINKAVLKIFGYNSKKEFINTPLVAHYYDLKDREQFVKRNKKDSVKGLELQFKRKDGSVFWGTITSEMITTEAGNTFFINALEDITVRKQAENELATHREQLEGLVKERTKDLQEQNKKLDDAMKVFVGRELTIRDLQNKLKAMRGE